MDGNIAYYVVLKTMPILWRWYHENQKDKIRNYIAENVSFEKAAAHFEVVRLPSNDVGPSGATQPGFDPDHPPKALVVALECQNDKIVDAIWNAAEHNREIFVGSGADLPYSGGDHWCPSEASYPMFADRAAAELLLNVAHLRDTETLTGKGVNVVIVDHGLDAAALGGSYASGWPVHTTLPGKTSPLEPGSIHRTHGMMVAHNVLQVAPDVRLFDLPLLPPRITDIPHFFLHTADAAYRAMLDGIAQFRNEGKYPGPWVLVNAWAVYDTKSDLPPPKDYSNNPKHPFNMLISDAVKADIDVVFCAGNCGQFCPDMRCGALDKGPGRSIIGANSHPDVLTVGAVRADALWLGYSSQGPGQTNLDTDKPDLCASSQFCETDDAFTINTGSSAACAMAAGVVAALRERWDPAKVPPNELITRLKNTALKKGGRGTPDQRRLGSGILDAKAAFDELARHFP